MRNRPLRNAHLNFRQFEENHCMENVVYNELKARGMNVDVGSIDVLERNSAGKVVRKRLEIDFVETVAGELAIIEVKAKSGRSKSADTVLRNDNYKAEVCYKLSENNVGVDGRKITLPYYMAMFLDA
jgi:predicted AAA+ superfamily ATPase